MIFLKVKIITVVAAVLLLLNLNVSAANFEYTLSPGDNFTSVTYGDDLSDIAKKLDMTIDKLNSYFSKNGLLYLAVSDDAKTQIRLSAFTDNFSSAVGDISNLDKEGLQEFKNSLSDDSENTFYTQSNDGRKFIATQNTLQDSGGVYTVTQYITVCDSQIFYLSCYNEGEETSSEVQSVFENFKLNSIKPQRSRNVLNFIIIPGIVIFSVIAVVMIVGIVKSVRNKNNFNENSGENNEC